MRYKMKGTRLLSLHFELVRSELCRPSPLPVVGFVEGGGAVGVAPAALAASYSALNRATSAFCLSSSAFSQGVTTRALSCFLSSSGSVRRVFHFTRSVFTIWSRGSYSSLYFPSAFLLILRSLSASSVA